MDDSVYNHRLRVLRFVEESIELGQCIGLSAEDVQKLIEQIYSRPKGECCQEVGGVMTTLAALCAVLRINMEDCGWNELDRMWTNIEKIKERQKSKLK